MKLKVILSIISVFLVYSLLCFYLGWNIWTWLRTVSSLQSPYLFGAILTFMACSFFISRITLRYSLFAILGALWVGFFQYGLLLFPLANLAVFALSFGLPKESVIFWAGYVVLFLLVVIFIYGAYQAYSPIVRKYEITISKKSARLKKLDIAMVSDMHFGILSGVGHLKRLVTNIERLQPEMILLVGDIIDDDPEPFIQKQMGRIMKELKAPLGVYGVLGNHDYYRGKIQEIIAQMTQIGIRILRDEKLLIDESFYLAGRKDRSEKIRLAVDELLQDIDPTLPVILMDHQPYQLDVAEKNGVDLLLSGHTHRGQMAPNHYITKKLYELDWGYLKKQQMHTIVSSGYGFWGPPLRLGSRSEIVHIAIQFV